jgi:hypothetical protein
MPDYLASVQTGFGMTKKADAGTSPVAECSDAGLRCSMLECRWPVILSSMAGYTVFAYKISKNTLKIRLQTLLYGGVQ